MMAVILLMLCLVMITWGLRNWFTFTELLALNMALYPAIIGVGVYIFQNSFVPQIRGVAMALLVLPIFLMSQTLPVGKSNFSPDSSQVSSYHTFKIGLGIGDYYNSKTIGDRGTSGCDGVSNTQYFKQDYTMGGAGYAFTKVKPNSSVTYGLNAYAGTHSENNLTSTTTGIPNPEKAQKTTIYGLTPYIQLDRFWFGIGTGLHIGNLLYTFEDTYTEGSDTPKSGSQKVPVYPQLYFRLGPTRYFFADVQLANQFPTPFPGLRVQFSAGSGLGIRNGTYFRLGTNGINPFIGAHIVFSRRFVLEPLYLGGKTEYPFLSMNNPSATTTDNLFKQRQFLIGLHYRFNHTGVPSK